MFSYAAYAVRLPRSLFEANRAHVMRFVTQNIGNRSGEIAFFKGKENIGIDSTDMDYVVN